ncbi:putative transmembrane protein [Crotalus adamanteus]|uniref:Dolichyl-diphosphooligosaccharide-protein glycosyltransferase subunit TMEM258 n=1 Tax=Crotalus adamanteus TaxID=8729 RepID=A0AAW1C6P9_CROAD
MTDSAPETEGRSEDGRKERTCPSVTGTAADAAMELETMSRYTSPVNPAVFPHLTVVLLAIGMFFTAWFFVYEWLGLFQIPEAFLHLLFTFLLNSVAYHSSGL